jgi:RNA polymerase sigma-70 factor (ECF subfamily)
VGNRRVPLTDGERARTCVFRNNIGIAATVPWRGVVSELRAVRLAPSPPSVAADEACLEAFKRELDYIYRSLRRLGAAPSDLDDLAQDVFLALRRSWLEYDARRPLRPYLLGIAFRITASHHRKTRRQVAFGIVDASDLGPRPDDVLQTKQARALVLTALERIPLRRRAVLVMHDLDDVPVAEVAAALAIPLFTAYSRLRKARRELQVALRRMLKDVDLR